MSDLSTGTISYAQWGLERLRRDQAGREPAPEPDVFDDEPGLAAVLHANGLRPAREHPGVSALEVTVPLSLPMARPRRSHQRTAL